jgi:hypothetical protein
MWRWIRITTATPEKEKVADVLDGCVVGTELNRKCPKCI